MEGKGSMGKRAVRRLLPVSPFDSEGLIRWFAKMAERGLFVTKTGYYLAVFQRGEPGTRIYSLEPFDPCEEENQKEKTEYYRQAGWEAAGEIFGKFTIFTTEKGRAERPKLPEELRRAGEKSLKKTGGVFLMSALLDIVVAAVWCYVVFGKYGFWYTATLGTPFLLCLLIIFSCCVIFSWRIGDYLYIRKYLKRKEWENGTSENSKGQRRSRKAAFPFAAAVVCLGLFLILDGEMKSWHQEIGELTEKIPVPPLNVIWPDNCLMSGTADYHSSILVPRQYEVVLVGDEAVTLRFHYLEMAASPLVQPVLRGLMKENMSWSRAEPEAVDSTFFDTAYEAEINENMHFFCASKGNRIVAACYIGQGFLDGFEEKIYRAMEDWTEPEAFVTGLHQQNISRRNMINQFVKNSDL